MDGTGVSFQGTGGIKDGETENICRNHDRMHDGNTDRGRPLGLDKNKAAGAGIYFRNHLSGSGGRRDVDHRTKKRKGKKARKTADL